MPKKPKKFCEFQREYDKEYKRFVCGIYDWQCSKPICSYKSKSDLESMKSGCDVANKEGQLIKAIKGDPKAHPQSALRAREIRYRSSDNKQHILIPPMTEVLRHKFPQ